MQFLAFVDLVDDMMLKQKAYFDARRKGISSTALLDESKEAEKNVRATIREIRAQHKSPSLFG